MIRLKSPPRARPDSVVPMINVAFLLLVFFLMTAVIAPPDPVEVTPPLAGAEAADPVSATLVVTADGTLALGELRGEAVFLAVPAGRLRIRADAGLDGAELARLIARLAAAGATQVDLVTLPR